MDQPIARPLALDPRTERAESLTSPAAQPGPLRRVSSDELLGGAREIEITHGGALYRLRLTQLGKLILTK